MLPPASRSLAVPSSWGHSTRWTRGEWRQPKTLREPSSSCGSPGASQAPRCSASRAALAWTELYTTDAEAASKFYQGLFGWSVKVQPGVVESTDDYFLFHVDGRPAAGMLRIKEEWGEVPPNWSIYFAVADLDDAIQLATSMGANQVMPPMNVEDVGRFALVKDPQGVYLNFIQLSMTPA